MFNSHHTPMVSRITSIFHMKKLRLSDGLWMVWGHTASKCESKAHAFPMTLSWASGKRGTPFSENGFQLLTLVPGTHLAVLPALELMRHF